MSALIEPGEAVPTHHELVDGVPVATPALSSGHQLAVGRLTDLLSSAAPDGLAVSHAVGVILAQDQRPIPDVVVVRQLIPRTNNFPADQVALVAEVVSLYAQAGVPSYLRVELDPLRARPSISNCRSASPSTQLCCSGSSRSCLGLGYAF